MKPKRIAILTGGGDCPGLNAVIRAVAKKAMGEGCEVVGIEDGYEGLVKNKVRKLENHDVSGIIALGGTVLGTSNIANPYHYAIESKSCKVTFKDYHRSAVNNFKKLKADALVAIGGDGTLSIANRLYDDGIPVVGVPKTIDNDILGTDITFGFDTAVWVATEGIDRIHTTAQSHHRAMIIEVMGRAAGWIALHSGIAGSADYILIPEVPINLDELCSVLKKQHARGKLYSIVVAAEGAQFGKDMITKDQKLDAFGHVILGGIGERLAGMIGEKTGFETRSVVLGHLQRGGSPSAFDRVIATRFGVKAMELVLAKKFGYMASLKGTDVVAVPIQDAVGTLKTVDAKFYELAKTFFG